jgi:predicted RNase H-like nuclease (RuvC/YqgF family)
MRPLLRFVDGRGHPTLHVGLAFLLVVTLFAVCAGAFGQSSDGPSLGDIARKERQRQQRAKDNASKPKEVITNEDLPEHPETSADSSSADSASSDGPHDEASLPPAAGDVVKSGEQWKAAITQQKEAVDDLANHIEKLNRSIHFVEANAYRNGVEYNKIQAQKQQEVHRLQGQLDEQKRNLEQMQESARKVGFGSAVWDP